jgi:hypothetical protein
MIIGRETKDNLATFAKIFEFFLALESYATGIDLDFKPFDTHVSSDMPAAWKLNKPCPYVLKCMLVSSTLMTLSTLQQWLCTRIT